MTGSLDAPPIVISMSRWKTALLLAVSIGFVAIGAWALHSGEAVWWAYLDIALFGLGAGVFVAQLLSPGRLVLSPSGVTWRNLWRTAHYDWWQIGNFRPWSPATVSKHVGFDYIRERDGAVRFGSFGGTWELSAAALCDLLNQARHRWAPPAV
jgi:hypothetical protein